MKYRTSAMEKAFNCINIALMMVCIIATLYPLAYVLFASFSVPSQLVRHTGILLHPLGFTLAAYKLVLANPFISSGYLNTIFIVVVGSGINITLTAMLAYVLSRKRLLWGPIIMGAVMFTMFFDGGMIPSFLLVKNLGLLDSLFSVILPSAINTMNLIILRTFFQSIPESLEESARIDGASDIVILTRIILPLSRAAIAVIVLYYAVSHWNSWFSASIYIRKRTLFPLQLILREILITNSNESMTVDSQASNIAELEVILRYAAIVVSTVPILLLYPFLQKYFVKGVMIGAVKG
ncbi:MAG: carbohydrate ABC transporter permease [Clostridiales bacterium]|jgi:putative aldouronate transport system permease protein|nr:carbohydrate ABC transporter permease [Clostridiales bacterium]